MSTPVLPAVAPTVEPALPLAAATPVQGVPTRRAWLASLAAIALLLLAFASPVDAATPRTTLEAVEAELMCVTCKTPLNQSHAPQAEEERALIEQLVAQGKTKDEVVDGMVAVYGDPVLIDPPQEGLRVARLALPVGAALFGAGLLLVLVRRWRRHGPGDEADGPAAEPDLESTSPGLTADDRRRLDADLERYA